MAEIMDANTTILLGTVLGALIGALGVGTASYLSVKVSMQHQEQESRRARHAEIRREAVQDAKQALAELLYVARPTVPFDLPVSWEVNWDDPQQGPNIVEIRSGWELERKRVEELSRKASIAINMLPGEETVSVAEAFWTTLRVYMVADSSLGDAINAIDTDRGITEEDKFAITQAIQRKREAANLLDKTRLKLIDCFDELAANG